MKSFDFQNAPAVDVNSLDKEALSALLNFVALAGIAVILPFFHNQLLTGPIVNALFYIAVVLLGVKKALFIALIPSVVAFSVGFLPFIIYPIIPFIIIGNIIQIFVFNIFYNSYVVRRTSFVGPEGIGKISAFLGRAMFWVGIIFSSISKFVFIFISGTIIFNVILKSNLAPAVTLIFGWPQLFTALAGGVIAYLFLKMIKKIK